MLLICDLQERAAPNYFRERRKFAGSVFGDINFEPRTRAPWIVSCLNSD